MQSVPNSNTYYNAGHLVIGVSEDTGQEGGRGVGKTRTIREK